MCCHKQPLNQKAELIELLPRQDSLQAFFSLDRLALAVLLFLFTLTWIGAKIFSCSKCDRLALASDASF